MGSEIDERAAALTRIRYQRLDLRESLKEQRFVPGRKRRARTLCSNTRRA